MNGDTKADSNGMINIDGIRNMIKRTRVGKNMIKHNLFIKNENNEVFSNFL
jgi:hypothetical protein